VSTGRSILQIADTFLPLAALWILMLASLEWSYWITLALAIPAALLLVRLFIIQHDCGHGSFFRSRRACDVLGSVLGVFTLTPYHYWRREHSIHHATSGSLDRRGRGDIDTLTVEEYRARTRGGRLLYRLYRHPLVLFLLGPIFHFIVKQRLPLSPRPQTRTCWTSIWLTNAALAVLVVTAWLTIGMNRFLLVQLPITILSCSAGVWLFYVQHQFEDTYWRHRPEWDFHEAALRGSSHYALGRILQWFTGNIGLHHIHHLNSRIPNYRLSPCLKAVPALSDVTRLTLFKSLRCARLTLWDEDRRRLVGFRDVPRPADRREE
jgi:omega-6 fatty acid desaturase (delta-12 desaturase)